MSAIWKYPLPFHTSRLQMPAGARVLCAQVQGVDITLWALVDPHAALKTRQFKTVATGEIWDDWGSIYIGTVQFDGGMFIFHVFEVPPGEVPIEEHPHFAELQKKYGGMGKVGNEGRKG